MLSCQEEKILSSSPIFAGLDADQIEQVLDCLQAELRQTMPHEIVIRQDEKTAGLFIVLSGAIELSNIDSDGRKSMVNIFYPGDCYCEKIGILDELPAQAQVIALDEVRILKLDINRIFAPGSCRCQYKLIVVENLVRVLSADNDFLKLKATLFSQKTLRNKLLLYLKHLSAKQKTDTVYIPFTRTELADFLAADRSALSRELGRMRTDKLIHMQGNRIQLTFADELKIS